MNSRLSVAIRERYGFCYTIESQFVPFADAGLFYIYAGVDADAVDKVSQLVSAELDKMRSVPLSPLQLRAAQRQMVGQMAIVNDNGLNEMQSIGKACLNYSHVDTLQEMSDEIFGVSADDVLRVSQRYFDPASASTLCYL